MTPPSRHISRVFVAPHFHRAFRKLPRSIQDLATKKDLIFRADAFDPRLRTHALTGHLKGLWSYSVDYHHRVLFEFLADHEVLYHDIGSHDVYR